MKDGSEVAAANWHREQIERADITHKGGPAVERVLNSGEQNSTLQSRIDELEQELATERAASESYREEAVRALRLQESYAETIRQYQASLKTAHDAKAAAEAQVAALRKYGADVIAAAFNRYGKNMDRPGVYTAPNGEESRDGHLIRAINCLRGLICD
jgi:chromosome segregation ATPase